MNTSDGCDSSSTHDDLIQAYLDGETSPEQEQQVCRLLKDPVFCVRLAQFAIDFACLHELAQRGVLELPQGVREDSQVLPSTPVAERTDHIPRNRFVLAGVGLAAAVLLLAAWLPFWFGSGGPQRRLREQPVLGSIQQATATVLVSDTQNEEQAQLAIAFRSGDTLRTTGPEGFAMLAFHDGTRLAMAGSTELVVTADNGQKTVVIRQGLVDVDVARQPVEKPMILVTPTAEARILGTRFALSAIGNATRLSVAHGKVLLKRLSDGRSVTVPSGYQAVASTRSELAARPMPPVPDTWSEDFEVGLPDQWRAGQWVTEGLPLNSRGAVRAQRRPRKNRRWDELHTVTSNKAWTHGLFRIEEDTYLNFTYQLANPGWFHIFVSVRPDDLEQPHFGVYEYKDASWWSVPAGGWRTASVPLKAFGRVPKADFKETPTFQPRVGDVVYVVDFSSYKHDRGLVIDRMWVTRGKPEDSD